MRDHNPRKALLFLNYKSVSSDCFHIKHSVVTSLTWAEQAKQQKWDWSSRCTHPSSGSLDQNIGCWYDVSLKHQWLAVWCWQRHSLRLLRKHTGYIRFLWECGCVCFFFSMCVLPVPLLIMNIQCVYNWKVCGVYGCYFLILCYLIYIFIIAVFLLLHSNIFCY